MGKHLRKLFSTKEVKEIFERYLSQEIGIEQALALLKIRRRQFFKLLKSYREGPGDFSLDYKRTTPPRKIDTKSETRIIKELKKEAEIIRSESNPVKFYNYSYLKDILEKKHKIFVSLPTIIRRAKKMDITRWVRRSIPATDSDGISATHSEAIRPPVPEHSGRP